MTNKKKLTNHNMPRTESDLNNPKTGQRGLIPPLGVKDWKLEDKKHKLWNCSNNNFVYGENDIKDFIKELKLRCGSGTCRIIDELAGKSLVEDLE